MNYSQTTGQYCPLYTIGLDEHSREMGCSACPGRLVPTNGRPRKSR